MAQPIRRTLAAVSATAFAAAGLGLAVPATATAAPRVETVSGATYVSFDDLAPGQLDTVEDLAEQVNLIFPGDQEVVFVIDRKGPRSAIGVYGPSRGGISLAVECDPAVDTWEPHLAGSCQGNEESLLD
ncbi:hypothetical protein O4090_10120 [Dietzia kunjamensis]|uniref:hypothetical protein n=1 Tax=Dietzia TaxID=37914 RepID=UPI0022B57E64|nr:MULTISPECIES: hypothetical protein [Dietzia]MCZ4539640.1 hypothetical protein [Dietzia maris]MCZ4656317.1 hypothetical protein [Dietzia kunjamensis]